MIKQPQPIVINNSNMTPSWAKLVTTKTIKVPLAMTFSGRRA